MSFKFNDLEWTTAPGHCMVHLDDPEETFGVFDLPEEKALYSGTVKDVGPHANHIFRLLGIPQFIKVEDKVVIRNIKQRLSTNVVIVETHTLLCKLDI